MFSFEPNEYLDHYPQFFASDFPNTLISSSSSSSSSPGFLNSVEFHHVEMHQPQHLQQEVKTHGRDVTTHDSEKRVDHDQTLKFTLCKNEDDQSKMKWMSSKMRLMKKMKKNSDHAKFDDQKQQQQQISSSNDQSNIISNDSSPYEINHPPIRVCSDCNTTKTPLWRSGPKGPKSLCNACGIRQRKARRALAAAAENGKWVSAPAPETAAQKVKLQNKELKKRCRSPRKPLSNDENAAKKKNGTLEDFLYNLSKSLAFHRVFPQEEKDAAILLMALSCSGVHG